MRLLFDGDLHTIMGGYSHNQLLKVPAKNLPDHPQLQVHLSLFESIGLTLIPRPTSYAKPDPLTRTNLSGSTLTRKGSMRLKSRPSIKDLSEAHIKIAEMSSKLDHKFYKKL